MLLDHFHPPLKRARHWDGFHSRWAGNIATDLNQRLPPGWFAEPTIHWGIEVDVGAFEETRALVGSGVGELPAALPSPPKPTRKIGFPPKIDLIEVQVFHEFGDVPLVGVIEFVSPGNKDRRETRKAFLSKCSSYLVDFIGLIVTDIVTDRHANLHRELMEAWGETSDSDDRLYTASYHHSSDSGQSELEIWYEGLAVGGLLPSMPLFLKGGPWISVDFATTYLQTCRDLRIPNSSNT